MKQKRRILFVDDERYVLDGLRRLLRSMRADWDMTFVDSGTQALELLSQEPYHVIVSDMQMPDMNGAHLLNEVMRLHPRTVRLVLSGHADDELIMQCVNATHQFLAKPCDPELLRATIDRTCLIEERSQDKRIVSITSKLDRLPSIPVLYDELLAKLRDPDASIEAVATVISRDPAMSAKILKLVNSAFFGLRRRVGDLIDAVNFLGMDTIRSLALSVQAFSQFDDVNDLAIDPSELWKHSITTATAARAMAESQMMDHETCGETFSAGLLHDMGRLVLAANFPEAYAAVVTVVEENHLRITEAETEQIGFNHAEVGAALFGIWGLPEVIVECAGYHHTPSASPGEGIRPLTLIHVADSWVDHYPEDPNEAVPDLDSDYLKRLGIEDLTNWHKAFAESVGKQHAHETANSDC